MATFLRSLANLLSIGVGIISFIAIFLKTISLLNALIFLGIILSIGFLTLIIYQMNKIERNVSEIEQKFKRADELIDIKSEILYLKNKIQNNEQKRTK